MLIVATRLAPSPLHGLGLFAAAAIEKGCVVSRFMPPFDAHFPNELLEQLSSVEQAYLRTYAYRSRFSKLWILPGDHDRFMNHSSDPNVAMHPDGTSENVAVRDIASGEELTCDYRTFDLDWREKLGS